MLKPKWWIVELKRNHNKLSHFAVYRSNNKDWKWIEKLYKTEKEAIQGKKELIKEYKRLSKERLNK